MRGKEESKDKLRYQLIYSKRRRTVGITVREGKIIVRAPVGTDEGYIGRLVEKHLPWIQKCLERQRIKALKYPEVDKEAEIRLRAEARIYFDEKLRYYSKITGISYGRVKITGAKKRFGSCNSRGDICFSYRLMLYPEAFREYVVLHELCHRVYMNHSPKFYTLVSKYMPDFKERKRLVK